MCFKRKKMRSRDGLRVRRATLRDLKTLVHHRRGMWEDMGVRDRLTLNRADEVYERWASLQIRSGKLVGWIVVIPNNGVVGGGCLWLRPTQPRPNLIEPMEPYLFSMFTEPRFRRKGVASRILKEAIRWSRKNGYGRILLHASKKGRRLYGENGFTRTWEMRLELDRRKRESRR